MRKVLGGSSSQLTTGSPFWPTRNPTLRKHGTLKKDLRCDVVVVGGGITGSLIAYRLALAGLGTAIVDKRSFGSGSTSASTALISYEYDVLLSDLAEQIGIEKAVRAYQLSFEALARLKTLVRELQDPCCYEIKSAVRITNDESRIESLCAEARLRSKHGMPVVDLDSNGLSRRFGISATLGLIAESAAQIDPLQLTKKLIERSVALGVQAFENTKLTQLEATNGRVRVISSEGYSIDAAHVVFATGYESERYLGGTKAKLTTDYCIASKPISNDWKFERCHMVEDGDDYLYVSTFGDHLILGIENSAFNYPSERANRLDRCVESALNRLASYLPDLEISVANRWASTFASAPDSLPFLGSIKRLPRVHFVLGYGGNGIACSEMLAPIVIDLITKGSNPDAGLFSLDR
jgi:glycine/D-amino acid oxidase-like deaminating enzyme